jgi:hypothetical protein
MDGQNITAKQLGNMAWGSHVEGALQLVKARGRSQLKTKIGVQLFIAVRTQLVSWTRDLTQDISTSLTC